MQMTTLPDIPDFISISTDSLDEAVDFSHALVELYIEFQYHGRDDKYYFIVDQVSLEKIIQGAVAGMMEELVLDEREIKIDEETED
jgi:hypothetical protein